MSGVWYGYVSALETTKDIICALLEGIMVSNWCLEKSSLVFAWHLNVIRRHDGMLK